MDRASGGDEIKGGRTGTHTHRQWNVDATELGLNGCSVAAITGELRREQYAEAQALAMGADNLKGRLDRPTSAAVQPTFRHTRIRPSHGWEGLNFGEIWEFRDLLLILVGRDVKLRYKQTALGVIWVILQPLLSSLVFAVIFGRLAKMPSDGLPYVLFVFAGMLPWSLFSGSLQRAGNSLIADSRLISKVYFPRMIIPMAGVGAVIVDFSVAVAMMFVLILAYQVPLSWHLAFLPVFLLLTVLVAVGVSLWVSAFNVFYRDFMYALPFIIQVWMYASPVVYSSSIVPERWAMLYATNPLTGLIAGFRWSLLQRGPFPTLPLVMSAIVGCLFFLGGAFVFRRIERRFADVI